VTPTVYPVRVEGHLEPGVSRWLWLVKWFLAIPHVIVLFFLWLAFVPLTAIALIAILFTGRYPRAIFDFNAGVLRWTWRVAFYAFSALGTDRYPPFSLDEKPDYPATLQIAYPERLSRGLALVKWWLLAIPHYLVVAILGGPLFIWQDSPWRFGGGGLIGLLVIVGAVVLLFSGSFPRSLFDLVLGLDRWVLRVAAYAGLMTDAYPPFRLDMGETEPGAVEVPAPVTDAPAAAATGSRWNVGRIVLVVTGSLVALVGAGILAGGAVLTVLDSTQRDGDGFLMTPTETFTSSGYALVSETADVHLAGADRLVRSFLGTVKVRSDAARPVFVGIAPAADVEAYLGGVRRSIVTEIGDGTPRYDERTGSAPPARPEAQGFWAASATGAGLRALTWEPREGDWNVVVMNADGSPGVQADVAIGAELDSLVWVGVGLILGGLLVLVTGAGLILLGAHLARSR